MSKQVLLGKIKCEKIENLNSNFDQTNPFVKGMRKGEYTKTKTYTFLYYRNGNVTTCIMTNGVVKGIGIAKKNPKDKENYNSLFLAEYRARADFYNKCAEQTIKDCL